VGYGKLILKPSATIEMVIFKTNIMRTKTVLIGLIIASVLLTSCDTETVRASEEVSSLDYSIPNYSQLEVSNAFNVYVTFSETEEGIRIEANENLHNRVVVKRDGNSLKIKLKNFTKVKGNATLNAYIFTKSIDEFDLSGASVVTLENEWIHNDGKVELSGSSSFKGAVSTERLTVDLSGASTIDVFGTTKVLNADLSGSSNIRDFDLSVDHLKIDLSGASEAFLLINETIDIEASGASTLHYKGNALITNEELSGASEIKNSN